MRFRLSRALPPVVLLIASASPVLAQGEPPLSKGQIRDFLLKAEVVDSRPIGRGVTRPYRLTLADGALRHDAAFQSFHETKAVKDFEGSRTELNFVDSYRYNLAAYALTELLGIDDMMPVTVERRWNGKVGALSWWVSPLMDEGERLKNNVQPPDSDAWSRQMFKVRVFAQLVYDTDRNLGNMLIMPDWKVVMLDFTRAFRRSKALKNPADLQRCERRLYDRLKSLTLDQVSEKTKRYLSRWEIEALMARRGKLVAHFEKLIAETGEDRILY